MPDERGEGVAGIVLAAGHSSRMGRNKLLIELDGEPLVRRAVRRAAAAGLDPLIVVLGYEADRVREALGDVACETVVNPAYEQGINSSVRLGIGSVGDRAGAAVVILADMPFVTTGMLAAVADRYRVSGAPLVISEYGGVRAPPTLYDRSLFGEFSDGEGEGCGKRVVRRHRERAAVLEWPADALTDLDRPDDIARVRTLLSERSA